MIEPLGPGSWYQHQVVRSWLGERLEVGEEQALRGPNRLDRAAKDDAVCAAEVRRLMHYLDRTGHVLEVHVRKHQDQDAGCGTRGPGRSFHSAEVCHRTAV